MANPPQGRRVAASKPLIFLADIHGHADALRRVLDEALDQVGGKHGGIFVAGDVFWGGEDPLAVWHLLTEYRCECVRGVSDTALVEIDVDHIEAQDAEQQSKLDALQAMRQGLGDLVLERIRRWPEQIRIPTISGSEVLLVHGSPSDPRVEMDDTMDDEEILSLLDDDPADIVVAGASHVAFQRYLEPTWVIGLGAVGAAPGGDAAHYAILRPFVDRNDIEQRWVDL